jgi:hypothetical protein
MTKPKKLDAEAILRTLAEIRRSIPFPIPPAPRRGNSDGRMPLHGATAEDFAYEAVAEGLQSLADDLQASIDQAHATATEKALEIYYAAEALSRDPAHAELIPHVQRMREAYEREHGKPIPPKE